MTEVWIQALGERAAELLPTLTQDLRALGIDTRAQRHAGPGIVLFDQADPATLEALREAAMLTHPRILAVAHGPGGLADGACWRLLRAGASDALVWHGTVESTRDLAARLERWAEVERLLDSPRVRDCVVGRSAGWLQVVRQVIEVATFTDASVLLLGESGTGKEEIARLIHDLDARPEKRELVTLDCTTVVPELSGSEFFGHEKGAFTGAVAPRDGAFALADGGTLFLDEVGELPLSLQAQLLRAVQEQTFKRVGGNVWHQTRFRLVCATNRELSDEVTKGGFRRDFFHRIASWVCRLPPLRERPDDILALASHFLRQLRPDVTLELDAPVREYLLSRAYPGNVRELRQVIARLCKRHVGAGPITVGGIPPEELPSATGPAEWQDEAFVQSIRRALSLGVGLKELGRIATDIAVRLAIAEEQGSLQRAAQRLGVTDRALQIRRAQGAAT